MKIFIYNVVIAFFSSLFLLPLWFRSTTVAAEMQTIFNLLVLPVILCALNLIMLLKGHITSPKISYFIIPISCILAEGIHYFNWGISTGRLLKPDAETVLLSKWFFSLSVIVPLVLWALIHLVLYLTKKFS